MPLDPFGDPQPARERLAYLIHERGRQFARDIDAAKSPEEKGRLSKEYKKELHDLSVAMLYVFLGPVLVFGLWSLLSHAPIAWEQLPYFLNSRLGQFVAAGSVVIFGGCFFLLRKHQRFVYASIEMGTALFGGYKGAAILASTLAPDRLGFALTFVGCVYIAVRAYDNFEHALRSKLTSRPIASSVDPELHIHERKAYP